MADLYQGAPVGRFGSGSGVGSGNALRQMRQPGAFTPTANPYGQRTPQTNQYKTQLDGLLTNPGSFSGTPGFQFALDQGMQGVQRSNSAGRNSGNALAELARYGTGLATQDYGNQVDRLGRLSGQQDQFNLGSEQNRMTGENNINQFNLGGERNFNDATQNANQFELGMGQNANTANRTANDFTLGMGQNANTAQNNWWNNENNMSQNANTAARNQNDFNTQQGRNAIDWFGANTQRGSARSSDYFRGWDNTNNRLRDRNANQNAQSANAINSYNAQTNRQQADAQERQRQEDAAYRRSQQAWEGY